MSRKITSRLQVEALEDRLVPFVLGTLVAAPTSQLVGVFIPPPPPVPPVPALSSNPGAHAKLYLDFDGNTAAFDSRTVNTPVFDMDGDRTTFSETELKAIRDIHTRVSEDFAPFNMDVTTINPGDFSNGHALRVAIGGDSADLLGSPGIGGISKIGSFTNAEENVVFVFSDEYVDRGNRDASGLTARAIADVVSHEAGHAFGLAHQSAYDANGNKLPVGGEYSTNGGSLLTAPIMGNPASALFSRWWYGPNSVSATTLQDDMAVLAGATNGFGYRADDHGDSAATATWIGAPGNSVKASGIIERNGDTDVFAFWSGGGSANFQLNQPLGANLGARLEFRDASGTLISMTTFGTDAWGTLPKGVIFVTVSGIGGYGNVGQYSLEGTMASTEGYTTTGPRVISPTEPVETYDSATIIRLAFDKPMAVGSLIPANFTLITPSGVRLQPVSVTMASGANGGRCFLIRVSLPEVGTYRLVMGPGVTDAVGNHLDQNGDGIQGDAFSLTITRKHFDPDGLY